VIVSLDEAVKAVPKGYFLRPAHQHEHRSRRPHNEGSEATNDLERSVHDGFGERVASGTPDTSATTNNKAQSGAACWQSLGVSGCVLIRHILPQPILMKPNRIGIPPDELIDIQAIDCWWAPDALLLSVDENGHELRSSLLPRSLFCRAESALTF
jgi:hypothetical protein